MQDAPGRAWRLTIAILLVAFVLRLAAAVAWQWQLPRDQLFFFPDSQSYWALGRAIAHGEPYQFGTEGRVFRAPGYPLILAGIFLVMGDGLAAVYAARIVGAVLGTVAVALVGTWAKIVLGGRAPHVASVLAAGYPGAIALSVFVLSEAPFVPLMLGQLICWTIADRRLSRSGGGLCYAVASGVLAGLASLCRPSWLLFTPLVALVWWVAAGGNRRYLASAALMLLGLAMTMAPWWIRNYMVVGRFVPTTLQVGASLYDGWNPRATGASDMSFVEPIRRQLDQLPNQHFDREVTLDRLLFRQAVAWAVRHPARVMELAAIKFLRLWNIWPNDIPLRQSGLAWLTAATYTPCLILGLVGLVRMRRLGWPVVLATAPALYLTLLHVVFVASVRYREPAMVAWMLLAAGAIQAPTAASREATS